MTRPSTSANPGGCCLLECRNGQIWTPGSGPSPCPFCHPDATPGKAA